MGTNNPPDGYYLSVPGAGTATWGTPPAGDVDKDTATANVIGDSCIKFFNTTPTGEPQIMPVDLTPVEKGFPYQYRAVYQVDSVAAGANLWCGIRWYDSDKLLDSTDYVINGAAAPSSGAWLEAADTFNAPADARYARPFFIKDNTDLGGGNSFTAYLDYMTIIRSPRAFYCYRDAALDLVDASWTKIPMNHDVYNYGTMHDSSVNYRFDVTKSGLYSIKGAVAMQDDFADGDEVKIALYYNGGITSIVETFSMASAFDPIFSLSVPAMYLNGSGYLDLRVYHNHGSDLAISATAFTYLMVAELQF